ncbi:MAG: ATP-grasp domain-containing protein [Acidobacteriia bacterium]|nr:ATP-grasp domain-containing protein [Terriglobia bacterium]
MTDTTRWSRSARIAIELANAGCRVSAVCLARRHPLLKTRAIHQVFPYSGLRPLDSLAAAIEAAAPELIIPCDDRAVQHLHQLHVLARMSGAAQDHIAALIERSLGPPQSYPIVSVRCSLLEIAREEGLRVPEMQAIHTLDDLRSWGAEHPLPWVLKADRTWAGGGVKIARTPQQAERFLKRIPRFFGTALALKRLIVNRDPFWLLPSWSRWMPGVIVQSHIIGRPANCAVVCWEGRVLAGIAAEVVSSDGPTGPASVVRIVDNPEMMLCAEKIAHRLGLSGFFGLDFMIEEGSGISYLIEMNPRCTPLCHLRLGEGRDMIGALYEQLSGRPPQATPCVTQNDMIAYFPEAWHGNKEILESSFRDVPEGEPELIKELLYAAPNSTLLARAAKQLGTYFKVH